MAAIATSLGAKFAGIVITSDDDRYDEARAICNGTVDARPALIARCRTADDIVAAVNLTRDGGLLLAVHGGGHSVDGLSLCDDGVVIDLSLMRKVTVDPGCRRRRRRSLCTTTYAQHGKRAGTNVR